MQNSERVDSLLVAVRAAVAGAQPGIWTAMPGFVESFDGEAGTCSAQPAIQALVTDKTGTGKFVTLPLCVDVPVQFIGSRDWFMTFPMKKGDEGLLIFSCRCIDAWWQSGGVQPQAELRMHDLSDGFFIPGLRSNAKKISGINTQFPELRNVDGSIKIQATLTGWRVQGTLEVTGPLMLGGVIQSLEGEQYAGDITTTGEIVSGVNTEDQVTLRHHVHPFNNEPPTPGT